MPNPQSKIMINKSILKRYLNNHIRSYIKEDIKLEDEEINDRIEEIIGWLEEGESLSRGEVIRRLDDMGIDPEDVSKEKGKVSRQDKYTYLNHAGWNITDTLYATIGQGQNAYTPQFKWPILLQPFPMEGIDIKSQL